jgi:hypothetical protein
MNPVKGMEPRRSLGSGAAEHAARAKLAAADAATITIRDQNLMGGSVLNATRDRVNRG